MNPVIIDATHRRCAYCYTEFERGTGESNCKWERHVYCGKVCAGKGGIVERKQRAAAKRRVICGDT